MLGVEEGDFCYQPSREFSLHSLAYTQANCGVVCDKIGPGVGRPV